MTEDKLSARVLGAWSAAAMLGPMAQFLGSLPWNVTALLGAGAVCLYLCAMRWGRTGGRYLPWVQAAGLTVLLAASAGYCGDCWTGRENTWFIPAALLALAAAGASGGPPRCSAAGATLLWGLAGLTAVLLVFAIPEIKGQWLRPRWTWGGGWGAVVMLLPCTGALLPRGRGRYWSWGLALLAVGTAVSLVAAGCISPWAAEERCGAFFAAVQNIQISGVAERFDALIAGVMTISWYCLMSMLLSAVRCLTGEGAGKWTVWASALAAFLGSSAARALNGWMLALLEGTVLFLAPVAAGIFLSKKVKKGVDKGREVW